MPCAIGFDKEIDYISHRNGLQWVLIRKFRIFLIVMPCAIGLDKEIDFIYHRNALRNGF